MLQDMASKRWTVKGVIKEGRTSEDGSVTSFIIVKENGKETIRNARHIKFEARKEKNRVRFAQNLTEEIGKYDVATDSDLDSADSSDDASGDREYVSNLDSAVSVNLATGSRNKEPELVTENPPVRASARLAGRKPF